MGDRHRLCGRLLEGVAVPANAPASFISPPCPSCHAHVLPHCPGLSPEVLFKPTRQVDGQGLGLEAGSGGNPLTLLYDKVLTTNDAGLPEVPVRGKPRFRWCSGDGLCPPAAVHTLEETGAPGLIVDLVT